MENQISFGAHESPPDYRDVKDYHQTMTVAYPPNYSEDLSQIPVTMQNKIGICTANLCYIIERLYQKERGINVRLSRRFLYTVTKHYIDQNTIEGSALRSVLKAAYKYGVALESSVPSDTMVSHDQFIADYTFTPAIWTEALNYRIGGYVSVGVDHDSLAAGIYTYGMLYSRVALGKEWYTSVSGITSWQPKDILPLRPPVVIGGGHAIVPYSYDAVTSPKLHVILRNSWSTQWANEGNADMFLEDYAPNLTEAWGVTLSPIVNHLPQQSDFKYTFSKPMSFGDTNEDVKNLQIFLKINGYFDFPNATGFYGSITQDAVFKFQLDHIKLNWIERTLYKGQYCGPKTIAVINSMI